MKIPSRIFGVTILGKRVKKSFDEAVESYADLVQALEAQNKLLESHLESRQITGGVTAARIELLKGFVINDNMEKAREILDRLAEEHTSDQDAIKKFEKTSKEGNARVDTLTDVWERKKNKYSKLVSIQAGIYAVIIFACLFFISSFNPGIGKNVSGGFYMASLEILFGLFIALYVDNKFSNKDIGKSFWEKLSRISEGLVYGGSGIIIALFALALGRSNSFMFLTVVASLFVMLFLASDAILRS